MKYSKKIISIVLIILIIFASIHFTIQLFVFIKNINDEKYISIKHNTFADNDWFVEVEPVNSAVLVKSRDNSKKFKPLQSGEIMIFCIEHNDNFLNIITSYAMKYTIDIDLSVIEISDKIPIYEFEKYDRYLFNQFSDDSYLHIDWETNDYPDITYTVTRDYETRTVNVTVYGSNSKKENDLRKIIEDHLNNRFQNLNEVMHDTQINITFEQSDIISDSDNDNISYKD
jgi:hypothetical protein